MSVVVPVFRNEDTLNDMYAQVSSVIRQDGKTFEFLFVNDCSPDGSAAVLKNLADAFDEISIISLKTNCGQQKAVLIGMSYSSGDYVVVMDADLQDPPEALPLLLSEFDESIDVVFAGRAGTYEQWSRMLTSKVFKTILHLLTDVPANAGIYCVLKNQAAKKLTDFWAPRTYIVGMIGTAGLSPKSVLVKRNPRLKGTSAYSFIGRVRVGVMALLFTVIWRLVPRSRTGGGGKLSGFVRNVYSAKSNVIEGEDKNG